MLNKLSSMKICPRFQPNSFGELCLLQEAYKNAKDSNLRNFEPAPYTKSGSMPWMNLVQSPFCDVCVSEYCECVSIACEEQT